MSAAAGAPVSAPGRLAGATRPVAATGAGRRTARTPYSRERQPLGDPSPLACTIAKAALEAVHGADTLSSLVRWVEPDLRARLARQHSVARRAGGHGAFSSMTPPRGRSSETSSSELS